METSEERKTRSGKTVGVSGTKRKRDTSVGTSVGKHKSRKMSSDDEEPISAQLKKLQDFLGNKIDAGLDKCNENIRVLSDKVSANEADLAIHKAVTKNEIQAIQSNLGAISVRLGVAAPGSLDHSGTYANAAKPGRRTTIAATPACSSTETEAYWRARRSARLSPVSGETERELWAAVERFFHDCMKIPRSDLKESDIVSIRRVLTARGRRSRQEVCVVFTDAETRDRIGSYARNLGQYVERGKPTVTFRHDVPAHLAGVHKILLKYGFIMGNKYGKGFRRNIRFDDVARSFCIDICLPGKNDWITVDHEQALLDHQPRTAEDTKKLGEAISTKGVVIPAPEEESNQDQMDQSEEAAPSTSSADNAQTWGSNK